MQGYTVLIGTSQENDPPPPRDEAALVQARVFPHTALSQSVSKDRRKAAAEAFRALLVVTLHQPRVNA